MKKIVIAALLALVLSVPSAASAAATSTGNGDPMAVMQSWGLTGYQTKIVKPGTVIFNRHGQKIGLCDQWMVHGCADLVGIWY